jgi:lipopolysaccharide export system permease protein
VTQRTPEGLVVIGARWTAGSGLVLNEATFLLFDHQGAFVERVDARRAVLEDDGWRLESARHTAVDGKRSDIGTGRVRSAISPQALSQYQVNPDKVSIFALPAAIETARAIGWPSARFATRLHGLIALPFLLAGLTLVIAVATLPFPKDGWGIRQIAFALALCFGLYVVMLVFSALSSAGVLSPVVAAWLPVAAVALAGTAGLLYVDP